MHEAGNVKRATQNMSLAILGWVGLAVSLFWSTFGFWACLLLPLCLLITLIGVLAMGYLLEYQLKKDPVLVPRSDEVSENLPFKGLPQITGTVLNTSKKSQHNRCLTGYPVIDDPLSEILSYACRDYIFTWYSRLSSDDAYINHIRDVVHQVIVNFSSRAKEVDWVQYLTIQLVDDFASHLRLFRQAQTKLKAKRDEDPSKCPDLLTLFFNLETAMERSLCRDLVCISKEHEVQYLQQVSEVLLYLLLPPPDFHNKVMRVFLRELLVNTIFLPIVSLVTDPDYINQTIVWLYRDSLVTSDEFLMVLRCTDNLDELVAVREIVTHEIAVQRSRDTGGDDDTEIKQQLSSLFYVQKVVDSRIERLREGNVDTDSTGLPSQIDWKKLTAPGVELFSLPFEVVLTNNIALSFFIDFMKSVGSQKYISFYLHAEGYKVSAEQLLSQTNPSDKGTTSLDSLREAAFNIYDTYISEKALSRIKIEDVLVKKIYRKLQIEQPSETWFDEIQNEVLEIMQEDRHFPAFKKTSGYIKLLAELELLKDYSSKSDEEDSFSGTKSVGSCDDCLSLSSLDQEETVEFLNKDETSPAPEPPSQSEVSPMESYLAATIYNTGIVREGNASYALYAISVTRQEPNMMEERWCIFRRYSDFHDFHLSLLEKFPKLSRISFPGKKTFYNLSKQFLERRKVLLNVYLQQLLDPESLAANPGLRDSLLHFLEPGTYERGKKQFARTVGALVNPLKSSVKNVGTIMKNVPDNLFDGLRDGLVKVLRTRAAAAIDPILEDSSKVGAGIDIETDENIPLRIMLLLMDEVFDLKSKNQWLRRRIVVILRQIIKATFGDTINRKIVDYVEWMTSADQIAEYIKTLKQALWPNGSLALPRPERDLKTRMRTRVAAKMIMLCSLSDELKHIIGSDTTRRGMLCVFELFQHVELNRRFFYVFLEGILANLFPKNKFHELFRKMHAPSPSISMSSVSSDPARSAQSTPESNHRKTEVR